MMVSLFDSLALGFDLPILDWIRAHMQCGFLDAVMPLVSALANVGILWIALAALLLFFPQHRKAGVAMAMALLLGALVCNLSLKPLLARVRPYDFQLLHFGRVIHLLIQTPQDFSFPSGHTIASFEAATVLVLYRRKWGIAALALASLIAFSRLYLYVHYPTDVLSAILLGVLIGWFSAWIVGKPPFNRL